MSEKHIPHHNQHTTHEKVVSHEHHKQVHEHLAEQAEKARREKSAENIEKIKALAELEAKKAEKVVAHEEPKSETDSSLGMQHDLKATAYKRVLAKTQQKLSAPARTFSKFTHSPAVDKVSSIGAETIARPSGLLGGSICAFLGSLTVYYLAKHYGFKYNYLFVFFLFIAGYLLGSFLELVIWSLHTRKQRY